MKTIDVCIPTYHPGSELKKIFQRLGKQTVKPRRIWIINTDAAGWTESMETAAKNCPIPVSVVHIAETEYDHGATRDALMKKASASHVLFMTQDAYPVDDKLVSGLLQAFDNEKVAVAYARQVAKPGSADLEKLSRQFNYPAKSVIKTKADLPEMGIKTFFCSNVCAMYRRDIYMEGQGFPKETIFNEDMIHARSLLERDYAIAYVAEAKVFHSHTYGPVRQFHRNFDLAYSQAQYPDVFDVASEGEGVRYVRVTMAKLIKEKKFDQVAEFATQCGAKYAGYFLGKHADRLPAAIIPYLTDNPTYFQGKSSEKGRDDKA